MASAKHRRGRKTPSPAGSVSEESPAYGGLVYVESSALLSALMENDAAAARALDASRILVTSAVTFAEAHRAVVRARVSGRIDVESDSLLKRALETMSRRCELVPLSPEILARTGQPFPVEPVRTLDAIHLATLEMLELEPHLVELMTRDRRIAANAAAMGYRVIEA